MRKINLLYVITKLELGGAQKQLLSIIRHLDKETFIPFLFTSRQGLLLKEAFSVPGLTIKTSRFLERRINPLKDILALIEIYRFIKKNNIDIVHTHSSKAGILGRCAAGLANVKFILHTVHGWSFNDYQPFFIRYVYIGLERLAAKFTHKLIVVSHYDKQKGLANRISQEDKYVIVRYGIDYVEFSKSGGDIRQDLGLNKTDLVVGMVSCLKRQKSPQDFIRLAFLVKQAVPNVKFILVGDGELRKPTQKLIDRLDLNQCVTLTGWRRDINRILSVVDIFVLTSLWEGLPVAVLEAMAAAIPVVTTNTGGVREVVIEAKTGFLLAPQDIKNMSERLTFLLNDRNLRIQMGQNAKNNLAFNFIEAEMVKNNQDLYDSLFKSRFRDG